MNNYGLLHLAVLVVIMIFVILIYGKLS